MNSEHSTEYSSIVTSNNRNTLHFTTKFQFSNQILDSINTVFFSKPFETLFKKLFEFQIRICTLKT
jgi:ribosome-associated toxin RatA of RatAB toxin-antitoxin module